MPFGGILSCLFYYFGWLWLLYLCHNDCKFDGKFTSVIILAGYGCFIYATTIANLTENSRLLYYFGWLWQLYLCHNYCEFDGKFTSVLLFWLVMAALIVRYFSRTPGVCGGGGYVLILL